MRQVEEDPEIRGPAGHSELNSPTAVGRAGRLLPAPVDPYRQGLANSSGKEDLADVNPRFYNK